MPVSGLLPDKEFLTPLKERIMSNLKSKKTPEPLKDDKCNDILN